MFSFRMGLYMVALAPLWSKEMWYHVPVRPRDMASSFSIIKTRLQCGEIYGENLYSYVLIFRAKNTGYLMYWMLISRMFSCVPPLVVALTSRVNTSVEILPRWEIRSAIVWMTNRGQNRTLKNRIYTVLSFQFRKKEEENYNKATIIVHFHIGVIGEKTQQSLVTILIVCSSDIPGHNSRRVFT